MELFFRAGLSLYLEEELLKNSESSLLLQELEGVGLFRVGITSEEFLF